VRRRPFHPDDPRRQEVHHVTDALGVIAGRLGIGDPGAIGAVLAAWPEVVGPAVAGHTTAKGVREGTLTVEVDGPEWTTQLRYLEADVVAKIAARVGPGVVERVRWVVRGAGGGARR
jgi:predicted nucleic acid-binding Zn ribbon protein